MMKRMMMLGLTMLVAACSAETSTGSGTTGDEANVTNGARLALTSDFKTSFSGTAKAGSPISVDYALERLPKCRGNASGGPGWNIYGYYSENGGTAKSFEVTALSADGKDRVAKTATFTPSQGGDVAVWFQSTSVFGCTEYDSQYGQNFHLDVTGAPPEADASITFKADGSVDQQGTLHAGAKVKVRYEQDRLPQCRQVQGGAPVWNISGYASVNGGQPLAFSTGKPVGSDREALDVLVDLPKAGTLALWFDVTSISGCHEVDSKSGANYAFSIAQ